MSTTPTVPFAVVVLGDPVLRGEIAGLVREAGLEPREFGSAAPVLARMTAWAGGELPALLVTGLDLPGLNGQSLCRLMRSGVWPALDRIPIVVIAESFSGEEGAAQELGAEALLSYPVDRLQFVDRIRGVLGSRRPGLGEQPSLEGASFAPDGAKETLERARELESDLDALLDTNPESFFLIDTQGVVKLGNRVVAERLGLRPQQIIGRSIFDFLPPDVAVSRRERVEEVVRTGKPVTFEDVRDGRNFRHHLHPVLGRSGAVERVAIFGQDITEYRQTEANLRAKNDLLAAVRRAQELFISGHPHDSIYQEILRILVEATGSEYGFLDEVRRGPDGVYYKSSLALSDISWDAQSRHLYKVLSDRSLEFRNLGNLAGAPVLERRTVIAPEVEMDPRYQGLPPGHPPLKSFMGIPLFFGAEPIGVAWVANREGGYTEEIAEFIKPLTQACAAMIWGGRLVQRNEEHLKALEASEEQYRRIVETANEGIWAIDGRFRTTYVNRRMAEMLGFEPEEMLGRTVDAFMFGEDLGDHLSEMAVRQKGQCSVYERRFRHREGFEIWTIVSATALRDEEGRFAGSFAMLTDLTARKRAEEERARLEVQLLQAQKMESVGRLAGGVAHDFNNMLCVILGRIEMALDQVDPGQPLFVDLTEIQRAAERSSILTRQLLAFARKQPIAPRVLDLNRSVEAMLGMLRLLIGESTEVVWLPAEGLWSVKVDPSQVDQILTNLCVNSRDAIDGAGTVTVHTRNAVITGGVPSGFPGAGPGDYVMLEVRDDGCGIEREAFERLFEPFFTTKGIGKGTGLGLPTVYGIVQQNRGFIEVASAPGKGSSFQVFFPRHQGSPVAEHPSTPEPVAGGRETILVVEDETAVLDMTARMLTIQGYTVLAAGTAAEALSLAGNRPGVIHLLLTDLVMPGMNGRDLAGAIACLRPGLKCLFMSGYASGVIPAEGGLVEGDAFIPKPFLARDLATKVRKVLDS